MIFVAATVAAAAAVAEAVVSTPGLTPSSNVTDFLCSDPCLVAEVAPVSESETDAPRI